MRPDQYYIDPLDLLIDRDDLILKDIIEGPYLREHQEPTDRRNFEKM